MDKKLQWLSFITLTLAACSSEPQIKDSNTPADYASTLSCGTPDHRPVHINGGTFMMGQVGSYPEEAPVRETSVDAFWLDRTEVTNAQFREFVEATDYVTVAELPVDPSVFPMPADEIPSDLLKPGSAVFSPPEKPSSRYTDWWTYVPGADWQKPYGPSGPDAKPHQPVVHLAWADMQEYAKWKGGRLPTEAEWEFAANAGAEQNTDQPSADAANTWQGAFPLLNEGRDGFKGIAPVGCFDPNPLGLYDMIGNVWEVTSDTYSSAPDLHRMANPNGPSKNTAYDTQSTKQLHHVIKGGSYLCAPNYCQRYRPAARQAQDPGLGSSNVGFRLAYDHKP